MASRRGRYSLRMAGKGLSAVTAGKKKSKEDNLACNSLHSAYTRKKSSKESKLHRSMIFQEGSFASVNSSRIFCKTLPRSYSLATIGTNTSEESR